MQGGRSGKGHIQELKVRFFFFAYVCCSTREITWAPLCSVAQMLLNIAVSLSLSPHTHAHTYVRFRSIFQLLHEG